MRLSLRLPALAAGVSTLLSLGSVQAAPQFVNGLTIAGDQLDLSGGTSVNNGRLGFFSDLFYDPNRNPWWGLSDRGPGGGTIPYNTRLQRFRMDVNPNTGPMANFTIDQTILFRNGSQTFNGLAPNPSNVLGNAFDPEGLVVLPFNGQFVQAFAMPDNLQPRAGATLNYTATPAPSGTLTSGREPNRGLEGLALSPDGRYAYAMLQNGSVGSPGDVGGYTPPVSSVPGPLPLAGAAAALGWSRRLRSRENRSID